MADENTTVQAPKPEISVVKTRLVRAIERVIGTAYSPHQLAFVIDNPIRRLLIRPEQLAERLALSPSSNVLEIGAGILTAGSENGRSVNRRGR